jgi:hypothetical protein
MIQKTLVRILLREIGNSINIKFVYTLQASRREGILLSLIEHWGYGLIFDFRSPTPGSKVNPRPLRWGER